MAELGQPSFQFSQPQIRNINKLWKSLDIISVAPPASHSQSHTNGVSTKIQPPAVNRRASFQSISTTSSIASTSTLVTAQTTSTAATAASSASGSQKKKIASASSSQTQAAASSYYPSLSYNLANLRLFQSKLCTKIMLTEIESSEGKSQYNSTSQRLELFDLTKLNPLQFKAIESNYQVIQLLQMIAIMINCIEYNRSVPDILLNYMAKLNARVYGIDLHSYKIFGEALILTLIEYKSEVFGSALLFEEQLDFNAFLSELLTYLVQSSCDPDVELPVTEQSQRAHSQKQGKLTNILKGSRSSTDSSALNRPNREDSINRDTRSNYSETSVKSSRLSLYSPSELDYDTSSLDEEVERCKRAELARVDTPNRVIDVDEADNISETTITGSNSQSRPNRIANRISIYDNSSDELKDDSYAYLNSFDEEPSDNSSDKKLQKKKSKLSFIRKSIVSGKHAFSKRDSVINSGASFSTVH